MFRSFEEAGYAPGGSPRKGRRKSAKKPATPKPAPRLPKPAPIQARPAVVSTPLVPLSDADVLDKVVAVLAPLLPLVRNRGQAELGCALDHAINLAMAGDSPYVLCAKETV